MSSGSNPRNERYFVDGFGKDWYVVNRTVAHCSTRSMAKLIAKLLIADIERKEHYAEAEIPEPKPPDWPEVFGDG